MFGTSITLTDTLGQVNSVYPTGTVTFYNGTTQIGTGTVTNGVATLTLNNLPGGTDTIKASYGGDNTFNTANSNSLNEVVTQVTGYSNNGGAKTAPAASALHTARPRDPNMIRVLNVCGLRTADCGGPSTLHAPAPRYSAASPLRPRDRPIL